MHTQLWEDFNIPLYDVYSEKLQFWHMQNYIPYPCSLTTWYTIQFMVSLDRLIIYLSRAHFVLSLCYVLWPQKLIEHHYPKVKNDVKWPRMNQQNKPPSNKSRHRELTFGVHTMVRSSSQNIISTTSRDSHKKIMWVPNGYTCYPYPLSYQTPSSWLSMN